jgi:hypothetical protein
MTDEIILTKRIRALTLFFIIALALSGITAIPLQFEMRLLQDIANTLPWLDAIPGLVPWINKVANGLLDAYGRYPFLAIGTDWLAFGHIVIAITFVGVLKDPVRNIWVIQLGLIACALVVPWAFIFGALRGIPILWQLVDCSFGVFGSIPLYITYRDIKTLTSMKENQPV